MSDQITTIAESDALPVGSIVIDAYAATCIRARESDPPLPSDWVRVTTAVKGGEHHHGPFLPADVERVGWSDYQSIPDAPARTEPTEEQVERVILSHFHGPDYLHSTWWLEPRKAAAAILALLPQRVAPSEEEIAEAVRDTWDEEYEYVPETVAASVAALYASAPTVAEVRALFAEELAAEEDRAAAEELASREVARVRCPQCDLRYEERDQYSCHGHAPHTYREDELREAAEVRVVPTYAGDELRARARAERGEA